VPIMARTVSDILCPPVPDDANDMPAASVVHARMGTGSSVY
jgi:hypothetical protein